MKSCLPAKEEEEMNQEVPANFVPSPLLQTRSNSSSVSSIPNSSQPTSLRANEFSPISWQPTSAPRRIAPITPSPPLPTLKLSEQHNWQASLSNSQERNAVMFNNPLMADVFFTVGADDNKKTIPCHKFILGSGSSVFYAMLYGGLAEDSRVMEIDIPDVEPSAFLILLR